MDINVVRTEIVPFRGLIEGKAESNCIRTTNYNSSYHN